MRTNYQQQRNQFQAKLGQNSLLQLVMAIGVGYILIQAVTVIIVVFSKEPKLVFPVQVLPQFALQPFVSFIKHPWVIFTYFWVHDSFWNLLSNMLWLYCFGSVIQTLIGSKEVITLFITSCITGALFYVGFSYFWPNIATGMILTSLPGVVAFATAAIVLAPKFKFYLGERLAIPLWLVIVIFIFLNLMAYMHNTSMMVLLAFSAIAATIYIQFVKSGIRPGERFHNFTQVVQGKVSPDPYKYPETKRHLTLNNIHPKLKENNSDIIDKILDKINQKGYNSLTQEEKDTLKKASEEIT